MKVEEIKLAFETNVQFALIDDAEKELYKGISIFNTSRQNVTKETLKFKEAVSIFENSLKQYNVFIAKAKEIGVDPKKGVDGLSSVNQYIKDANLHYNTLMKL